MRLIGPVNGGSHGYGTRERSVDLSTQAALSAQKSSVVHARDVEPLIDEARAARPL